MGPASRFCRRASVLSRRSLRRCFLRRLAEGRSQAKLQCTARGQNLYLRVRHLATYATGSEVLASAPLSLKTSCSEQPVHLELAKG